MKICLLLYMWFLCTEKLAGFSNYNQKLDQYLNRQSILLREKLRTIRDTKEETTDEQILSASIPPNTLDTKLNIFTFINTTFIATQNELFIASMDGYLDINLISNFSGNIDTIFLKTFEHKHTGFIAIGHYDEILIYTLAQNSTIPQRIQSISAPFNSDAIFFVNGGQLYLVSATNHGEHMGLVTIYQWLDSHFDELTSTFTTGPTVLGSFRYKRSEIIIVGQSLPENAKIYSAVYEFKQKKMRKILLINTYDPTHMDIFFQNGVPHVLIYEERKRQLLYKWNGFEMVLLKMLHWEHKVDKSFVVYSNATPLIVQPQLDRVLIYKPLKEDIVLERTKQYPLAQNYSVILDINKRENENGNITFIAGLNEDNIINIYAMTFKVQAEMEKQQEEALSKCFINLEQKVYDRRKKLNQTKNTMSQVDNAEKNTTISRKREAPSGIPTDVANIENKLEQFKTRLEKVKPFIINHGDITKPVVVDGKVIIKGNLKAKNITSNNLNIKKINSRKWLPEQWLKYKETQNIAGSSKINQLRTKNLTVRKDTLFKNLLRHQGNQTIKGSFNIKHLTSTEVFTNNINDIDVANIYLQSEPITIKGLKSFDNISTQKAFVTLINNATAGQILNLKNIPKTQTLANEVFIDNLEVNSIDEIKWSDFRESLFKVGEDETIEGNLIIPEFISNRTTVVYLNGIDTKHLMTKSTDQVINSSIEFNNIEASEIECNTVNDIDILKSAAFKQNGTVIKGPVRITEVFVKNDLELIGKVNQSFFINETGRTWGTDGSDLIQRYLGKIVIHGNVYVKDFALLPNTTIITNDNEYTLDTLKEYWTKNTEQEIPVNFEAIKGLSTSHLNTKLLNAMPMDNFALNNKMSKINSPLFFENMTVQGNVYINKDLNNSIELDKLAKEGVRKNGGTYQIKGKKAFKHILRANHLKTEELNGQNIEEMMTKPETQETKAYKKLIIKGNLISNIETETINGIEIEKYIENILPLDRSKNLTDLAFKNVSAENLYVNTINGHSVSEYLEKLEKILSEQQLKTVNIKGNIKAQVIENVKTINADEIGGFLEQEMPSKNSGPDLIGNVNFTMPVKLGNLITRKINGINFPELSERLLYKKSNQTVSGVYTFKSLKTDNLYTDRINENNVKDLIDISREDRQQIRSPQGMVLKNVSIEKSLEATVMLPCDLYGAVNKIHYPETQEWSSVEIHGDVKFIDESCELNRIWEKSVKKDEENVILAPITFNGHVLTNRVKAFGKINGINLTEIIEDAVLSESNEEQVITGHKIFHNIEADTVYVLENTDIPLVNNIFIPELYKRIISKDQINNVTILGKKTFFGGLQTDKIFSKKVAGVQPENIVDTENLNQIPNAIFDKFEVINDFNVRFINSYDFDYVLNNRILTNSSGKQTTNAIYFFKDLEVQELRTPSINNIELRNVVFDVEKQKITAPKRFLQNVGIFGNVSIGYLNGINISDAYENSIIHGRTETINGSLTILKPVRIEGNVTAQSINGYPIEQIKKIMESSSRQTEEGTILNTTKKVKSIIMETLPAVQHMPNEFMYIERSDDLQIKIRNAIDARVTIIKDYALIHVLSEESHIKCNLPEGCKCPVQHTVEITPHLSVSYFLNKGQQRIYSYDDDTMTIHLITNSISTDTHCRTNQTKVFNEMSTMTWSTTTSGNVTGTFNIYPAYFSGYISGAEFFTLNGVTYAIIARYYDPVADTHDLDCTILKFSDDKSTAMEIQKIFTHGVWTLYLFHTAQGVTLVVGNLAKHPYTEIYRFREDLQKFELLRTVAYGCTKAVGVVLGTDSLIILANKDEPLQVLKYNSHYDNYDYYQMFALDEPVVGISVFYVGGFGISDAYLCIVTEEKYRIYSFQYVDGWTLESTGTIRGLRNLIPVELNNQLYLFAPSSDESSLLTIVKHGAGET